MFTEDISFFRVVAYIAPKGLFFRADALFRVYALYKLTFYLLTYRSQHLIMINCGADMNSCSCCYYYYC